MIRQTFILLCACVCESKIMSVPLKGAQLSHWLKEKRANQANYHSLLQFFCYTIFRVCVLCGYFFQKAHFIILNEDIMVEGQK